VLAVILFCFTWPLLFPGVLLLAVSLVQRRTRRSLAVTMLLSFALIVGVARLAGLGSRTVFRLSPAETVAQLRDRARSESEQLDYAVALHLLGRRSDALRELDSRPATAAPSRDFREMRACIQLALGNPQDALACLSPSELTSQSRHLNNMWPALGDSRLGPRILYATGQRNGALKAATSLGDGDLMQLDNLLERDDFDPPTPRRDNRQDLRPADLDERQWSAVAARIQGHIDRGEDPVDHCRSCWLGRTARHLYHAGKADQARRFAEFALFRVSIFDASLTSLCEAEETLGRLARDAGNAASALRHAERAWLLASSAWDMTRTGMFYGSMLRATGNTDEADTLSDRLRPLIDAHAAWLRDLPRLLPE